ncbi:Major facilitator superfamily (MFS) profile domain-containing protein [Madurella fahalii]|uniref:Major facilitator superfamily (MFS) profile domain-containing protein n=1 Tax=Madurella fahalii TaxID=1157608 RepID=A0ABQ0GBE6_9PEZI
MTLTSSSEDGRDECRPQTASARSSHFNTTGQDQVSPAGSPPGPEPARGSSRGRETDPDSIHTADTNHQHTNHLSTVRSGPDIADHTSLYSAAHADADPNQDADDSIYDRFPRHRKVLMVALLSFCSFLSLIASTSVLAATPEVATEYATDGTVINIVNAVYMLAMGVSPVVWGPMSQVYGRRPVNQVTAVLFFGCSIGTALAPNLAAFFAFRILTALEGTAFILVGSACIGDIYRPTERATALGWFLSETIHHRKVDDLEGYSPRQKATVLWGMVNLVRVSRLFVYPNLIAASLGPSVVIWNMYSLLTPIRYVLNPRFQLTTPMQSGLLYLVPGTGYLVGTLIGGRYADHVVKAWIAKRDGTRVPEDRLRSALPLMGLIIPACVLVYGWALEKDAGGIPLAVATLFVQGVAQLIFFPSLNTYCLDVMQGRGAEVIAGNFFVRYLFACAATACALPAIETIGVGWFSTIAAVFLAVATGGIMATISCGKSWRDRVDGRCQAKRLAERRAAGEELGRRDD